MTSERWSRDESLNEAGDAITTRILPARNGSIVCEVRGRRGSVQVPVEDVSTMLACHRRALRTYARAFGIGGEWVAVDSGNGFLTWGQIPPKTDAHDDPSDPRSFGVTEFLS